MAMFKMDLLFRQLDAGASEVYYVDADSRTAAAALAVSLGTLRAAMMPEVAIFQGYRLMPLSPLGLPAGKQKSKNTTPLGIHGVTDLTRSEEDVAFVTTSTDGTGEVSRTQHLRFVPREWQVYTVAGVWNPPIGFDTASTNYVNQIVTGVFFLRQFNSELATNPQSSIVNLVSFDGDGLVSMTINDDIPGLVAGDRVKIKGYAGAAGRGVNGMYRVLGLTGRVVALDRVACTFRNETTPGAGAIMLRERYLFEPIDTCTFDGLKKRDTGRSFFLGRGRRSKRGPCRFTPAGALLIG